MKDTMTISFRAPIRLVRRMEAHKERIAEKHYPLTSRVTTAHLVRALVLDGIVRLDEEASDEG